MALGNRTQLSEEARARIDFVRSVVPKRKPHYVRRVAISLAVLIVLTGFVWLLTSSGGNATKPKTNSPTIPAAVNLSAASPDASYSSNFFNLNFKYPKNWALKDNNEGLLNLTSPLTHLVQASGENVKGYVVLTITKQGALPVGLTTGTDLAVLDSSLLTYSNPSSSQSGQAYLSFVQYSSTNTKGGLDGVYLTGNYGYQKDQVISMTDIGSIDPLVYVSFNECVNNLCSKESPLTIASSSWVNSQLSQIITAIAQSFVFN